MVAVPPLVSVIASAADAVACSVVGKVMLVALSFSAGAAVPVPVNVTFCGDPAALSVTLSVAESDAADAGLNPAYSVHEAPAASEVPHVPISTNEVGLVPPSAIEVIVSVAVPAFLSVIASALLVAPTTVAGKAMVAGVSETAGAAGAVPVPVSFTDCGVPVALSAKESAAVSAPAAAGLNSTETVHEAPAASVVPQVVADLRNDVALVPVIVSEVRLSVAVPEFFTVTTCAAVVEPTVVDANVRLVALSVTAGAVPVPVSFTDWGVPVALSATESAAVSAPAAAG